MHCGPENFRPLTSSDLLAVTRRHFFSSAAKGIGGIALAGLLGKPSPAAPLSPVVSHAPKAKRVIYLFQSGGPSQHDLFDYKPLLNEKNGEQLPHHVRGEQRLTAMSAQQSSIPLAGSVFKFAQHGESGA